MLRNRWSNARIVSCLRVCLLLNIGALCFGLLQYVVYDRFHVQADKGLLNDDYYMRLLTTNLANCPTSQCNQVSNGTGNRNSSEFQIPNIVHYIWFNEVTAPLQFHHMLSVLSAHKVLDPDVIYFHTNHEPSGKYWELVKMIPSVKVQYRDPPVTLFGEAVQPPKFYTSHSNVDRVKILMEYGGIYLDFDVLVTRPFDDLRRHSCVIGLEQETKACGSVIACEKSSFFLRLWINSYLDDYRMNEWAYNTGKVPANLARRFPHLVHVERTKLNHPNFKELDRIWGPRKFDWWENYAVHIWYRIWKKMSPYYDGIEPDPETIKHMNNSFGEMARSIYYGSPDLIPKDQY